MQGHWERAIYTLSVRKPHPLRIVLFYFSMLTRVALKICAIYLFTELYQRKYLITLFIQCRYK